MIFIDDTAFSSSYLVVVGHNPSLDSLTWCVGLLGFSFYLSPSFLFQASTSRIVHPLALLSVVAVSHYVASTFGLVFSGGDLVCGSL